MKNARPAKHILVLASTFPASDDDPVPQFVKEQIIAMHKAYPELTFSVLAPHDMRSSTKSFVRHTHFDEYRFHYAWPRRFEKLAGRGIMPQLKKNPLYYLLVPGLLLGELRATKKLVTQLRPDYLYAHWFTPQGIVAGIAGKHGAIPVIITTHASDVSIWKKLPFGGRIVRHYIPKAKAITAVSTRTLDKLKYFFGSAQWEAISRKTSIIPMGADFMTVQQSHNKKPGKHVVFVGRLAEKKGVQYLLQAFAGIVKAHPEATLTIAGDGPLREQLQKQAAELNIAAKTTFAGWVNSRQKTDLFDRADVYVVPSIITKSGDAEGLPVSLMEGMHAGKVCIATNESGADDILTDGKDGLLIPQQDVPALQKALAQALTLDDKHRQAMQMQAVKTAEQFDWKIIAKRHYDFLFK